MRRLENERGAVAVLVAILMTALIGFAAIGIDVAHMASDKQQLQNGADAGALAIAQYCSNGGTNCVDNNADRRSQANSYADTNKNDGDANVEAVTFKDNEVTVTVSDDTEHWFAPVFGLIAPGDYSSSPVRASATAGPGPYGGGTSLPLGVYMGYIECLAEQGSTFTKTDSGGYEFSGSTLPTNVAIYVEKFDKETGCSIGANWIPGGFGWLETINEETCSAFTTYDGVFNDSGDNGLAVPKGCKKGSMDYLVDTTLAMPIFENPPIGGGGDGTYTIDGHVAFHVLGFDFPSAGKEGITDCKDKCIYGYFDTLANISGTYNPSAPDWGNTIITLKK